MKDDETQIVDGKPAPSAPVPPQEHPGSPGVQINESDIDDPGDPDSPTTENDVT